MTRRAAFGRPPRQIPAKQTPAASTELPSADLSGPKGCAMALFILERDAAGTSGYRWVNQQRGDEARK